MVGPRQEGWGEGPRLLAWYGMARYGKVWYGMLGYKKLKRERWDHVSVSFFARSARREVLPLTHAPCWLIC